MNYPDGVNINRGGEFTLHRSAGREIRLSKAEPYPQLSAIDQDSPT